MSFLAKLAIFWCVIYAIRFVLLRFPESRITRLAFSWRGPFPIVGETRSHYRARWFRFALKLLGQIILLLGLGYLVTYAFPSIGQNQYFLAIWAFALPLLAGMAILGGLLAGAGSLIDRYFGSNPAFSDIEETNEPNN